MWFLIRWQFQAVCLGSDYTPPLMAGVLWQMGFYDSCSLNASVQMVLSMWSLVRNGYLSPVATDIIFVMRKTKMNFLKTTSLHVFALRIFQRNFYNQRGNSIKKTYQVLHPNNIYMFEWKKSEQCTPTAPIKLTTRLKKKKKTLKNQIYLLVFNCSKIWLILHSTLRDGEGGVRRKGWQEEEKKKKKHISIIAQCVTL